MSCDRLDVSSVPMTVFISPVRMVVQAATPVLVLVVLACTGCAETFSTLGVISDVGFMPLTPPSPAFAPAAALSYATYHQIPEASISRCFEAGERSVTPVSDKFTPFATMRLSDGAQYIPGRPDYTALQAQSVATINVAFGATVREQADAEAVRRRVAEVAAASGEDAADCKAALSRLVSGYRCFRAYFLMSALKATAVRYQFLTAEKRKVSLTDNLIRALHLAPEVSLSQRDRFTLEVQASIYIGYDVIWSFAMFASPSPGAIPVRGTAESGDGSVPSAIAVLSSDAQAGGRDLLTNEVPPLPSGYLRISSQSGFRDLWEFRKGLCLEPATSPCDEISRRLGRCRP